MKMVRHQAIRVGFGNGGDIQSILLQKIIEIFFLSEYILKPVGMVENMKAGIGLKRLHVILLLQYLLNCRFLLYVD
jgi:hypothetical protein